MSQSIGTGIASIRVPETLTPGQIYRLPAWPIINTGDAYGCFEVAADPQSNLVSFNPQKFCLDSNKSQLVTVSLALPLNEPKGKRDFVLEARKVLEDTTANGSTSQVGAAVGTNLTFEVGQSPGILGALSQRANSLVQIHLGLFTLISIVFCLVFSLLFARRAFDFKLHLKLKK